jgi:LPXTG-motif cell wall-anchored protein
MSKRKNLFLLFILLLVTGLSFNVNAGPFLVPNVVGQDLADAMTTLDDDPCCSFGGSTRENNPAPINQVISQIPVAGTDVTPVQSVTVVVSDGPATTTTTTTTTIAPTTIAPTTIAQQPPILPATGSSPALLLLAFAAMALGTGAVVVASRR